MENQQGDIDKNSSEHTSNQIAVQQHGHTDNIEQQLSTASPAKLTMMENQQGDIDKNSSEHTSHQIAVQQHGHTHNIEPQLSSASPAPSVLSTMTENEQHDNKKQKGKKGANRPTQSKNSIAADERRKQQRDNTDKILVHEQGRKIAEDVSVELSCYPLAVRSLCIETFVISNLVRAFDPHEVQLQLVRSTARDFLLLMQNLFVYKDKLRSFEAALQQKQSNSAKERLHFAPTLTVGTILCSIAACEEEEMKAESDQNCLVDCGLNHFKEAMARSKIGCKSWLKDSSNEITCRDISVMKDATNLHQFLRNLLLHCLHLLVILDVEENMTMHQLLGSRTDKDALNATTELWDTVNPGKTFDPKSITMKTYRERIIFPARLMISQRHNALKVAGIMSNKLTGARRREITLLFAKSLDKTIDGKVSESSEDYCGGKSEKHRRRRRRMACLLHVMSSYEVIEHHMPREIIVDQFIPTLLLQPTDLVRRCFGFLSGSDDNDMSLRDEFFDNESAHDETTEIGKKLSLMAKMKDKNKQQKEQVVIIDTKSMKYLQGLLLCNDSSKH